MIVSRSKPISLLAPAILIVSLALVLFGPAAALAEGENVPPIAIDDIASTDINTAVTIDVVANDTDTDGDTLSVDVASLAQPANGSVAINIDGTVTYTPNTDFEGIDTFIYYAYDETVNSENPATVTIDVGNQKPVAIDDSATTEKNIAVIIDVVANDTDIDGDTLSVDAGSLSQPANGSVAINSDGTVTYMPKAGYKGVDTFSYYAYDGTVNSENPATVTVTVSNGDEEEDGKAVPPGQMVRRGLSGPIAGWDLDSEGAITYLYISTNFGTVRVDVSSFGLTEEDVAEGMRVVLKLADEESDSGDDDTGAYRTAIAEDLKANRSLQSVDTADAGIGKGNAFGKGNNNAGSSAGNNGNGGNGNSSGGKNK
ncbi:MAG: cadherin-like domain-containing protein [Dehalococcoidia bacterium]|nr:cadherin-like domain-containing protein [Dehalococcoidia bacterium]